MTFEPTQTTTCVKTTCPYCGVGCGVLATVEPNGEVTIKGDPDHPANYGRLCSKGSALADTLDLEGRLLRPEIDGHRATWDKALDLVADKFSASIKEHGPDSVAFYVSGQLLTEDYYVANKLMKGFIGSANIDTNSRLCMASSVAGHKRAFGADTVPGVYEDLELADLIVLVGSNLAWCHPVLYQRIAAAKQTRPEMKVVLIDPRKTMTADLADMHLPIKPDGDTALFTGLLHHLVETGTIDEAYISAHTNGFEKLLALPFSEQEIVAQTGLSSGQLAAFYQLFAETEKTVTVYSQGVNQSSSGTDKVNSIINCHLATGRIGKPGAGPFSVTGQPNAMGGREVGGLSNMLACHMDINNPDHRNSVQTFWQSPTMPTKFGLKAVDLFDAVAEGQIKALWIMSTNPVVSMPDANKVERAIRDCPFVVVSDIMAITDTMRYADVKLPATGWGEKNGTVTNSERRISRQRAFLPAPGEAKPDWWQLTEVAKRMGHTCAFEYKILVDIFGEYAALSAYQNDNNRDFDIGAYAKISESDYQNMTPFQWPQSEGQSARETRFFAKGNFFTPDKKANFIATKPATPKRTSKAYPFTLNTGRVRDHWHTMTRTGKAARLSAHSAESACEIHPEDALKLGVRDAELVRVQSPLGETFARALLSDRQRRGEVFVPMHWTDQFAANSRIDTLVSSRTDPISGQPATKNIAVNVVPFEATQYGYLVCRDRPEKNAATYWALAKCIGGWRIELASDTDLCDLSKMIFSNREADLTYHDNQSGQTRLAWFDDAHLVAALFVAPRPVAASRNWAVEQLSETHDSMTARANIVAGRPGADRPDAGAIVCACFSVGVNQIVGAIEGGCTSVDAIGIALKAGTNCGSCRAEINGILNEHLIIAAE